MRAQSNNVYRSFPDDAAPTRYSARPSAPSPYRSPPPSQQQRPKHKQSPKPPPKPAAPSGPKKRATEQELKQERRIRKLQQLRTEVLHNQVREIVETLVLELGDERLIARAAELLKKRDPTAPEERGQKRPHRRYVIFPSEKLGAAINARAKTEGIDRLLLIDRILAEALDVPLESVKLKPQP